MSLLGQLRIVLRSAGLAPLQHPGEHERRDEPGQHRPRPASRANRRRASCGPSRSRLMLARPRPSSWTQGACQIVRRRRHGTLVLRPRAKKRGLDGSTRRLEQAGSGRRLMLEQEDGFATAQKSLSTALTHTFSQRINRPRTGPSTPITKNTSAIRSRHAEGAGAPAVAIDWFMPSPCLRTGPSEDHTSANWTTTLVSFGVRCKARSRLDHPAGRTATPA